MHRNPAQFTEKQHEILECVTALVAREGAEQLSMRTIAKKVGLSASVLYHYFQSKEELLLAVYLYCNKQLGLARAALPTPTSAHERFRLMIQFQFEQAERVVAVLRYYYSHRDEFAQRSEKILPAKAILHVQEALQYGIERGEYVPSALEHARAITHAINGYLLEYFPYLPKGAERERVVGELYDFILLAVGVSSVVGKRTTSSSRGGA